VEAGSGGTCGRAAAPAPARQIERRRACRGSVRAEGRKSAPRRGSGARRRRPTFLADRARWSGGADQAAPAREVRAPPRTVGSNCTKLAWTGTSGRARGRRGDGRTAKGEARQRAKGARESARKRERGGVDRLPGSNIFQVCAPIV